MSTQTKTFVDEPAWRGRLFSGGWRRPAGGTSVVREPATGAALSEIGLAVAADVPVATASATAAQTKWIEVPYETRAAVFRKAAMLFEQHAEELVDWIVRETGSIAPKADVELRAAVGILNLAAGMLTEPQ